ncbi:putative membrane protein [Rubellimicrobium mesophilum DSM 19309]|uniref:Putative membrane protein n=1 Tax=Rubellimicrobium mesophilum DSM 19309 TaxID=442562 RepID=A0A017HL43_9RHOB|nr:anti-sigma factor [Rubellimicrobium mesophilum]EYD75041.1 putative membrane protein [Rubellimicrobium mesophilum DSM 19309]
MSRQEVDSEELVRLRHGGPERRAELAALADGDATVRQRLLEWDRQDDAIRALYGPIAGEPLPWRHLDAVRGASGPERGLGPWRRAAVAAVALVALGALVGWSASHLLAPELGTTELAVEAFRAHATFAPEVLHPVEVSDEAELSTWLSRRLGQAIRPPRLDAFGYRLVGGRIVPADNGPAALLMYEDEQGSRLTILVARAASDDETGFRYARENGLGSLWWSDDGLACAVVGELPRAILRDISQATYDQLGPFG